jgi:hypothetical protein
VATGVWRDLASAIDAPLEFDLNTRIREATTTYAEASATTLTPPKTFRELLTGPHPPIELLKLAKDFAKTHAKADNGPLPRDIATMLYFANVAVALVRYGERITKLDDDKLRKGVEWAIAQSWLDETSRGWFYGGAEGDRANVKPSADSTDFRFAVPANCFIASREATSGALMKIKFSHPCATSFRVECRLELSLTYLSQ